MSEQTLPEERPTYEESVQALESETAAIVHLLDELRDDQWHLPTRLPGWDVFILVAHLTGKQVPTDRPISGDPDA